MECNCIQEIEELVKERYTEDKRFKKPISTVRLQGIVFTFPNLDSVTCNDIEIELEGQKKKEVVKMHHTYCPFCGVKIKKEIEKVKVVEGQQ